jgi:hypothetical protein
MPLTVDRLIYASSVVLLDPARRNAPVPGLTRWLLGPGIAPTLAANVAHGLGHGLVGAAVAAWSAVALAGSYELFMLIIPGIQCGHPGAASCRHLSRSRRPEFIGGARCHDQWIMSPAR